MIKSQVRTDLALEARESLGHAGERVHGIRTQEYDKEGGVHVTKVFVDTRNAASTLGKPIGTYVTMEAEALGEPDDGYHREISAVLAEELKDLLQVEDKENPSILVVGLGNREVTADALGPRVLDNLYVTRHMVRLYGKAALTGAEESVVSCLEPGVMAKTGMETAEIIGGVIEKTKPDAVVVIDALAARSTRRLNRTIQLSDAGIQPGSGVGNHRNSLTRESLGVPVIAVGVPTVVDAATIVDDALEKMIGTDKVFQRGSFVDLGNMYMTGKDVDEIIKRVSYTISEGINMALQGRAVS